MQQYIQRQSLQTSVISTDRMMRGGSAHPISLAEAMGPNLGKRSRKSIEETRGTSSDEEEEIRRLSMTARFGLKTAYHTTEAAVSLYEHYLDVKKEKGFPDDCSLGQCIEAVEGVLRQRVKQTTRKRIDGEDKEVYMTATSLIKLARMAETVSSHIFAPKLIHVGTSNPV